MKVNLVKWVNVLEVVKNDKEMLNSFMRFYEKLKDVTWTKPSEVLSTFNSADIIRCEQSNRIVFNVGGNRYRLITGYYFGQNILNLYVKFVGTHREYDEIDACAVNMFDK